MKDRIALIVGAANSVGQAISMKFAKNGAKVVLLDTDQQSLNEIAGKVAQAGLKPEVIALDPSDVNAVKAAVETVVSNLKSIDILVNNMDWRDGVSLAEGTVEIWSETFRQNISPVVTFCINVIPAMRKAGYGRIVTVGSLDYLGAANKANYCTAKSAVFGMTRSLALELAKDGITVNQVLKGDIKGDVNGIPAEAEEKAAAAMPVQRLGIPEDIAYAVAYLAAGSSNYVTGQNLIVCGGKSIYSSMSA